MSWHSPLPTPWTTRNKHRANARRSLVATQALTSTQRDHSAGKHHWMQRRHHLYKVHARTSLNSTLRTREPSPCRTTAAFLVHRGRWSLANADASRRKLSASSVRLENCRAEAHHVHGAHAASSLRCGVVDWYGASEGPELNADVRIRFGHHRRSNFAEHS